MRGLNNEQVRVMQEIGPPGAEWRRKATFREAVVIVQLERRKLVCGESVPAGLIVRLTPIGRLLLQVVLSNRLAKGF